MTDLMLLTVACGFGFGVLALMAAVADVWDPMGDQRRESERRNGRG